jgi:acyl-homoserine lactone acylase PvdQ
MPTDQLAKYDSLAAGYSGLTDRRSDVTIVRDKSLGVPHITGTTRAGTEFGAGYAAGQDRLWLMDVLRHAARGQVTSFAGGAEANRELEQSFFANAPYTEAELQKQIDNVAASGPRGAQGLADAQAYVDGINKYITDSHSGRYFPGEYVLTGHVDAITNAGTIDPFKLTDLVALASLVGAEFGAGGGGEVQNAVAKLALQEQYGATQGEKVWQSLRSEDDPEAVKTLHDGQNFPYGKTPANAVGQALPDKGSVTPQQLVFDKTGSASTATPSTVDVPAPAAQEPARGMFDNGVLPGDMLTDKHGMSNALVVSGSKTASGHPVAVFGPQTGYFAPQLLLLQELQGPGISARGAAFAGLSMYVLLGRGQDYSWSATTSAQDIIDTYALNLCDPSGKAPTKDSNYYTYQGQCVPMDTVEVKNSWSPTVADGTAAGSYTLRSYRTKYGPVASRATVGGKPVAYAQLRSSLFHEADSLIGFQELNDPGYVKSAADFQKAAADINFTFNWFYADSKDIAYFNSGANPARQSNVDPNMPVWGDQGHDWTGWNPNGNVATYTPASQHPQSVNQDYYVSWNNAQANGYAAAGADKSAVHRVDLLDSRVKQLISSGTKVTRVNLTQAMEDAALSDLRAERVLPLLLQVLDKTPTTGAAADAEAKLKAWLTHGQQRKETSAGSKAYTDADAIRIFDAWWPLLVQAEFKPGRGGSPDTARRQHHLRQLPVTDVAVGPRRGSAALHHRGRVDVHAPRHGQLRPQRVGELERLRARHRLHPVEPQRPPLAAEKTRQPEVDGGAAVARHPGGHRVDRPERRVEAREAADQRAVDTVLLTVQNALAPRVVRQPRRERVVGEGRLEQSHRLHVPYALGQPAQRERHQTPAEAVPHEMHPQPGRHLREPPDQRAKTALTDRARAPLHGEVRCLPQQFMRAVPDPREPERGLDSLGPGPASRSRLTDRELAVGAGPFLRQRPRELPAHLSRVPEEHLRVALRPGLRHGVRRERRPRRLGAQLDEQPYEPPELLQRRFLVRLLVQHPGDLVDQGGPAGEDLQQTAAGALVQSRPDGRRRHRPLEVGDRLVREPHRRPHHAHEPEPGVRREPGERFEEPAVEPCRPRPVAVPAVREHDQILDAPLRRLLQQPVALPRVHIPVRVERQLPVGSHTHFRLRHDEPPSAPATRSYVGIVPLRRGVGHTSRAVRPARTHVSAIEEVLPAHPAEGRQLALPGRHDLVGTRARVDHRADPRGTRQLVDPVVGAPTEAAPHLLGGHQQRDPGAYGVVRGPVVDMDLHAPDGLALELREGRREVRLPEVHTGQPELPRLGGPPPVDALRAEQLERAGRAAPLRQVRPLEETRPRVHERGVRRRHVGARRHPGEAGGVVEVRPLPARHQHGVQRHRRREELLVEQPRQLRHRHPVRLRDRLPAHEGRELLVQHGTLGAPAGHRVRPVEHHEPLPGEPGRLHAVVQRPDVRVEAGARVLDVEDDGVHAGGREDVGQRLPALQIRVVDREAGRRVVVAALGAAGLGGAAEAVLGAEDGHQVHPVVRVHDVDDVADVACDAGRVGDDADAFAVEEGVAVRGEALEAGPQAAGAPCSCASWAAAAAAVVGGLAENAAAAVVAARRLRLERRRMW